MCTQGPIHPGGRRCDAANIGSPAPLAGTRRGAPAQPGEGRWWNRPAESGLVAEVRLISWDSCIEVATATTAAYSGMPRFSATWTIARALSHWSVLGVNVFCDPYSATGSSWPQVTDA